MSRFTFPGFTFQSAADTATHEIERGTMLVAGKTLMIDMIKSKSAPQGASFLAASVTVGNDKVWTFQSEGFGGFGFLVDAAGEPVIALVTKANVVERVIPLAKFAGRPFGLQELIRLKRETAKALGGKCELTAGEKAVVSTLAERRQVELQAERDREHQEKLQRRVERRQRVMARDAIEMLTSDGQKRYGRPVYNQEEWQCLAHATHVILMDETGQKPVEYFMVVNPEGRPPSKSGSRFASGGNSPLAPKAPVLPQPVALKVFEFEGDFHEVPVYGTMEDVRILKANGLNSSSKVAIAAKGNKFQVMAVKHDGIDTLGVFAPLN
jgi:hypothetical protein